MKKPVILVITAIFFALVLVYATSTLSPWDKEKFREFTVQYAIKNQEQFINNFDNIINSGLALRLINFRNVALWAVLFGISLITGFAGIHSFIDKLFFKKFFENPRMDIAFRRGIFLYLTCAGLVFLRLIGGLFWYNALAIISLFVALEITITNMQKHQTRIVSEKIGEKADKKI